MFGLRKRTWVIGGVVAALIGTGAIASRYHNPSIEDRADFATYMISKKLELNDTQEASLDKLAESWVENAGAMKSFRNSMFDEIKSLASGENLSVDQVNALRDKIKSEFDQRTDMIVPQFVTFYNSLEPEQKSKITARLEKASKHMQEGGFSRHWGKRGHGQKHGMDSE